MIENSATICKQSHYYSIKVKIKVLHMCQTCPLVIKSWVCDSLICFERVSLQKELFILYIFLLQTNVQLPVLTQVEAIF